jgi:hypothetical protein
MDKIINNRKFRLLLACISLLILVNLVQETYAKYVSSADATSNLTIARWAFTVNNQDIIANSNFSNTIVPVFDANANISTGVIAPTSTGYFDITIDSSNVGVSFDEVITLSASESNTVDDLVFTGYKKNDGEIISFGEDATTFTTTHLLGEANTTNTYRFFIAWIDGTGETMDNADDTEASLTGTAAVNVNIRFIQKASN